MFSGSSEPGTRTLSINNIHMPEDIKTDEAQEEATTPTEAQEPKKKRTKRISELEKEVVKKSKCPKVKKGTVLDRAVKVGGKIIPKGTEISVDNAYYTILKSYLI